MDGITSRNISNMRMNTTSGPSQRKEMEKTNEPQDQVTLQGLVNYSAEDVTPQGTVGVIISSKDPEKLEQLKEKAMENPKNKIKADLHLINGFAVEISPDSDGIIADLGKSKNDVNVCLDGKISIDDPAPQNRQGNDVHPMMDTAGKAMGLDKVWGEGFKGKGMKIAIVDTGIAQHPDVKDRIIEFKDIVNGKNGKENAYDDQGHGTHCAGIAAGDGRESGGKYVGAAPEADLIGVKVMNSNGSGSFSDIISGVQWVVDQKKNGQLSADVMSLSLGGNVNQSYKEDPIVQAVEKAVESGIITVVAAGNSGYYGASTIGSPGSAPHVLTVGAMDDKNTVDPSDDTLARFSSQGPTSVDKLPKPDILTPGVDIMSLDTGHGYTSKDGTSMATPLAAGMAALIKQADQLVTPGELKGVVMGTATDLKGLPHNKQGAGVFNIAGAIERLTGNKVDGKKEG